MAGGKLRVTELVTKESMGAKVSLRTKISLGTKVSLG